LHDVRWVHRVGVGVSFSEFPDEIRRLIEGIPEDDLLRRASQLAFLQADKPVPTNPQEAADMFVRVEFGDDD
jgi:hypothetical protein